MIGIPAGVIAAVRRGKASDYTVTTSALIGLSVPHFWLGLLLIIWFAVDLHWLPASGYVSVLQHPVANLEHLVMPCIVLGLGVAAVLMRQTRSSMLIVARRRLRPYGAGEGPQRADGGRAGTRCATA